jgi:DNA-directed RNA polymerase specialized sigma24 family protein
VGGAESTGATGLATESDRPQSSRRPPAGQDEVGVLGADLVGQLRRLPAADRDTLLLVVWGELSYEEAATALAVPVGTIRSRIARARRRLTTAIDHNTADAPASAPPAAANGETNA